MSTEDSSFSGSTSQNSTLQSIADNDMKASNEKEIVHSLELKKKRYELEINQLEMDISNANSDNFSRDQLPSVKSELENDCNQMFLKRTNALTLRLEQFKAIKLNEEKKVKNLQRLLQNEQRLTRQLIEERESHKPPRPPPFPEVILPELSLLRDRHSLPHRLRALNDETREAERQLSMKHQSHAENDAKLLKIIQDSKATTQECEAKIRAETLELAQLEETRNSLRERLEANKQRHKQLENEKRMLLSQIEAAESTHKAKIDEINRNFIAAQREFDEARARKQAEIRDLTKKLHENEELNRAKMAEKERLIMQMNELAERRAQEQRAAAIARQKKRAKQNSPRPQRPSQTAIKLQAEIDDLQRQKEEVIQKTKELLRKGNSNEKKLNTIKEKIEQRISEAEAKLRRTGRAVPSPMKSFNDDSL